ncbi:MAG: AbrB/MazE/SpoVT family DNA-binding domain-containing protein [Deltaproteobacteria bacterium]|nr:AbrB/MazE/SpoVT family DNA-binding domain-containing protein [Deltaproteobacteria bacterium]
MKKLLAVGDSLGLIIDPKILEQLHITQDTPLEITTDGKSIIIRPVTLDAKERIRESTQRMMAVHDQMLRELAK